jgi:hypothetical protein
LVELEDIEEHFKSGEMKEWSPEHSASSGVSGRGVKKTCKPGETRDVNGGVDV